MENIEEVLAVYPMTPPFWRRAAPGDALIMKDMVLLCLFPRFLKDEKVCLGPNIIQDLASEGF